jgi:hypothetical protein
MVTRMKHGKICLASSPLEIFMYTHKTETYVIIINYNIIIIGFRSMQFNGAIEGEMFGIVIAICSSLGHGVINRKR